MLVGDQPGKYAHSSVQSEEDSASVECHADGTVQAQDDVDVDLEKLRRLGVEGFRNTLSRREEAMMGNAAHAALYRRLHKPRTRAYEVIEDEVHHADDWAHEAEHDFGSNSAKDEFEAEDAFSPKLSQMTTN